MFITTSFFINNLRVRDLFLIAILHPSPSNYFSFPNNDVVSLAVDLDYFKTFKTSVPWSFVSATLYSIFFRKIIKFLLIYTDGSKFNPYIGTDFRYR